MSLDLMGGSVRDKLIRPDRRSQPPMTDFDATDEVLGSTSSSNPVDSQKGFNESAQNPNSNPSFDETGTGYCTEEQLEEMMLKRLEAIYDEALAQVVASGYDKEVALQALLNNGHCYGERDPLTNIVKNCLGYLEHRCKMNVKDLEDLKQVFTDLRQLHHFSLACLVCLVRRAKPSLSRGDAMWCLLMCGLHAGHASSMDVSVVQNRNRDGSINSELSSPAVNNMEKVKIDSIVVAPASCRFDGGLGIGSRGPPDLSVNRSPSKAASEVSWLRDIEFPNLSPSMNRLLKSNVASFAAEYRANMKKRQVQSQAGSSSLSDGDSLSAEETRSEAHPPPEQPEETPSTKNQERINMILRKLCDLKLEGNVDIVPEDQKDEMVLSLAQQIKDLERQLKERKEWAHQKAMQAARKLSHDLTELKMLRMEREENQRLKHWRLTAEEPAIKRLSEMEIALRKASGQVDRVNAAVRILETENAVYRAEMEASKLGASESVARCLEVARREKKYLKRLSTWEKQRAKLQEDITAEKQKIIELREEMLQVEEAKNTAEAKWRQEQEAKELALAQVEEERRLKEAAEVNIKRNHEALCSKIELDFQRYKDDIQRLEQELSCRKSSSDPDQQSTNMSALEGLHGFHPQRESIVRMLHELDDSDETKAENDRECIICLEDEVSVVFLPCAHQVLCASCNDDHWKKGKIACPTCRVSIEQRIRVYGAGS